MTLNYAVYPGSELLDLGPKCPAVLCESLEQAKHMKTFWGEHGRVVPLTPPITINEHPEDEITLQIKIQFYAAGPTVSYVKVL